MAKGLNQPLNIKANFQLDTTAARQQLMGLQRELNSLTSGATSKLGVTEQLTEAVRAAQLLKQTLNEATDFKTGAFDLSKFTTAMNQNMMSIEKFKQSLATLGPEGEKTFNNLATTIASAQVPLKRTSAGMQELLNTFSNTMRWQATSMAIHKVVGTISEAYNYAQNLDKSLNRIQIVTGHNVDYMKNFAREANKAAQALSASTLEYTNASLIYYQQGLSDKEVTKRAETTLKLAKVTGESASKVSQQMTAVWNNFSNGVDNLERYADVMTALGATTASSSSEIAKGLEKFASISKTIGLSYDYAASALATVTAQTRQSADSVGTAFKTLFSRLESLNLGETLDDGVTLNKYSEALMKVGVNVLDVNGHLKNMDSILDDLGGRWDKLNQAQQVALAQTIGGVRNYTSLITLMDNWEKFQTNVTTASMAEGTLQKQADIYAKSWEAAQQRVKTASQGIYDTLISSDFFKGFNNAFAGILNTLNKAGQTLGTGGSIAGLANLFLGLRSEQVAKSIDNGVINLFGQTSIGQNYFKSQQQATIASLKEEIMNTGSRSADYRGSILDSISDAWSKFRPATMTKQAAQAEQNLLMARTSQGLSVMNALVDLDQQGIGLEMGRNAFERAMIGQLNIDPSIVASYTKGNHTSIFSANSQLGLASYLESTFGQSLQQLQAMDGNSPAAQALTEYLQKSVTNMFGDQASGQGRNPILANMISAAEMNGKNIDFSNFITAMTKGPDGKIDVAKALEFIQQYSIQETAFTETQLKALDKAFEAQTVGMDKTSSEYQRMSTLYQGMREDMVKQQTAYGENALRTETNATNVQKGNISPVPQTIPKEMRASFGEGAVATGQMLSSMAMATNSVINFKKQLDDGTATATGMVSTLGSLGLAAGQMASVLGNPKMISSLGITVSQLGLIGMGIAAAGGIAFGAYKYINANSLDSRQTRANENQIQLSALAKENQIKYEQFLPVMEQYQEALAKTLSLQIGTAEYTSNLLAANNQAREIIEAYGLQAGIDYSIGKQGNYEFSSEQIQSISDTLLERSQTANIYAQLGTSANTQLKNAQMNRTYAQDRAAAYARHNLAGYDSVESYDMMYAGYATDEMSAASYQQGRSAIRRNEIRIDNNLAADLETIEEKQDQLALANKADFQVALNSIAANTKDFNNAQRLAIIALGEDTEALEKYSSFIENELTNVHGESLTHGDFGALLSEDKLRQNYNTIFGFNAAEDATRESMAAEIYGELFYREVMGMIDTSAKDLTGEYFSDFLSINTRRYDDAQQIIKNAQNSKEAEAYSSFIQKYYADSTKSQENLARALQNNTLIQENSNINLISAAGELQSALYLSNDQMNNLSNYINAFGTSFGDNTGQAIYDILTNNGTLWNQEVYSALQNISTTNSLTSLADLKRQSELLGNKGIKGSLDNLQQAMIRDINDRGGLAKTLFSSSDFQNVFQALQDTFSATGNITAENIADLAKKNETLNSYLELQGTSSAAAVADMASMLASGKITLSDLTPAVEAFALNASTGGMQQQGLKTLEDQDLSTSYSTIDKYYQNGGKAWATAVANDMLNDAPLQEFLQAVAIGDDYAKIQQILLEGTSHDTKWMVEQIKSKTPELYKALETWDGSGKKENKGGGGLDDALYYYGSKGLFKNAGITVDENGKIHFTKDEFNQAYESVMEGKSAENITEGEMYEYFLKYLTSSDRGEQQLTMKQAQTVASQMVGKMSATSLGQGFKINGIIDAEDALIKELESGKPGENKVITGDAISALAEQYMGGINLAYTKGEDGTIRRTTAEEQESGNYTPITQAEYEQYLANRIAENGGAIISLAGTEGLSQDIGTIGSYLSANSYGTIKGEGPSAIIDAAIKSGVTQKTVFDDAGKVIGTSLDYQELEKYYTDILKLPVETFQDHLPDIVKQLSVDYSGAGVLQHSYKDIFGNEHNIFSRDFINTKTGEIDYNAYAEAVTKSEETNSQLNNYVSQRLMDEAWEAYNNTDNTGKNYRSFEDIYQGLINREQQRSVQKPATQIASIDETGQRVMPEDVNAYWNLTNRPELPEQTIGQYAANMLQAAGIDPSKLVLDNNGLYHYDFGAGLELLSQKNQNFAKELNNANYNIDKAEEQWYTENKDVIVGTAGTYAKAIDARIAQGGLVNQRQQQLLDLYNTYTTTNDTNLQNAILKRMDQILTNTDDIVSSTGELVDVTSEEEGGLKGKRNGQVQQDENGNLVDEEGNPIDMPTKEAEKTGGGVDTGSWYDPNAGKDKGPKLHDVFDKNTGTILKQDDDGNLYGSDGTKLEVIDTSNMEVTTGSASGQNNHILQFASGKKPHIAVTGELGPELRIKEDGTADLLGKKGREYTWVEPGDKIYTASQTAGILGNNSIPQLEGLARGIRNYIPGYFNFEGKSTDEPSSSSSGGGGRGGGGGGDKKDPRYDPNTLKIRDVLERYYTILQKIDDITRAVEKFSKVADRAWGKDRIKAIEKQTELYQKQYDAQKKYVSEIGEYLNTDEAALTTMIQEFVEGYNKDRKDVDKLTWEGAEFDENGVLTNYRDFVEKLVSQYNEHAEKNARDKKAQYKFQEQLKDIQFYTDTLNTYEAETDKLMDLANQIIDSSLKEITYRVEYELELNNDLERVLDFKTDLVKDNVFKTAEYLALLNDEMQITADNLSTIQQGVYDYLGTLAGDNMRNGKIYTLSDLGIATRGEINISENDLDYKAITEKLDAWITDYANIDEKKAKKIKKAIKRNKDTNVIENYLEIFDKLKEAGLEYTEQDLGLIELGDIKIDYDEIDFKKVTENLETWLEELRIKDAEAAEEVDKIIKRGEDGLIENYREIFDKINAMNQRLSLNSIELLKTNVQEFFDQLSSIQDNPAWSGLTTEQKDQLTNYMDQTITELNKLRDQFKTTIESLGDALKDMNKKIGSEIDEFGYYGDVYGNFLGILQLTNRHMSDISSDLFKNLNNKVFDNNINKIKATNTNLKLQADNLAEVNAQYENMIALRNAATANGDIQLADFYQEQADLLKEQLDIANKAYEDSMKDFQQAWKDALEGAKTAYEEAIKEASRTFEDSFSPFFHTLELLEAQYAREKALGDLYVDDYQRIHDLSKLNRDIENSILDTDNLRSKERLRDLQKEINDLQDSGVELSEYDLDILDKKYKLELARQALEDARDAKSLVRLSRDNNGNWGYVYTSNEDDVVEAEQQYEDAIREMEEANENYIENLQDQMLQVQKEAQQAIQALSPDDFGTWDEYMAAIQAITGNANQTLAFLAGQMNNALGNNGYLAPFIEDRYGVNDHNLTTDYEDTPLAKILGITSLDQMTGDAFNRLMGLGDEAGRAWVTFQENQEKIFNAADHDIAHIGEQFTHEMETVARESEDQVDTVENLADRIRVAFADTAGQVSSITDEWADSVKGLIDEYSTLLEVITELKRIDGEYVEPTKMINADNAIDTWKEISDFKKNLAENGVMSLITTGENGQEFADTYIAGSAAANAFIKDSMVSAARKDGVFNFDDSKDPISDFNKLSAYLKKRGVVVFKWKDEEHIAYDENDEWFKKLKDHIEELKRKPQLAASLGFPSLPYGFFFVPGSVNAVHYSQTNAAAITAANMPGNSAYQGYIQSTYYGDTGMYTGEWAEGSVRRNGRLAFLHQKELVLNAHDTENFLDAMEIVRQLDNLTNWMANGLGDLFVPNVSGENGELEQNVHIEASFPNVTDHSEIEMAFDNLVNRASQYANRK